MKALFGCVVISSYLLLFVKFFFDTYNKKTKKPAASSKKPAPGLGVSKGLKLSKEYPGDAGNTSEPEASPVMTTRLRERLRKNA